MRGRRRTRGRWPCGRASLVQHIAPARGLDNGRNVTTPTEERIGKFLSKYASEIEKEARAARRALRKSMPSAVELVYDNYNALVFAFGPSEKASEIILSIALYPRWVTLFFLHGADLDDP